MKQLLFITLAGICLIWSCTGSKKTLGFFTEPDPVLPAPDSLTVVSANSTPVPEIMSRSFRRPIRDKELYTETPDMLFPDTVYIAGDTLHVITKPLQECDSENFKLLWNGLFLKSSPPQAILKIMQVADPACRKRNSFHLIYNLTPVRYKQDSIHTDNVIVKVRDWRHPVTYAY